jgi:hypothetical protein
MFRISRIVTATAVAVGLGIVAVWPASGSGAAAAPITAATALLDDGLGATAIEPTSLENLYTSVKPCRIVDTRQAGGALTPGVQRNFKATGSTSFTAQGGTSGGCGVPSGATAIVASFKSVDSTGEGYLRAWAWSTSEPAASTLTFDGLNVGDGVTVPITSPGASHFSVKAYNASTQLVVDVMGYFAPQIHAKVTSTGAIETSSGRITSVTKAGTGIYTVYADRNLIGCTAVASAFGGSPYYATAGVTASGGAVIVHVWNHNGSHANGYFDLIVQC